MSPQPELPEPAHADVDSMLSRKFGKEVANYFSGSPLNRVSFLRGDNVFLSQALLHPTSSFLLFNELKPLVHSPSKLALTSFKDIQSLIGDNPFAKTEEEQVEDFDSTVTQPQMIFLGLDEGNKQGLVWKDVYKGAPMWAVDVTPLGTHQDQAKQVISVVEGKGLSFQEGRMILSLPAPQAATYAQARALLDWNSRNPFCGGCGNRTMSVNAGGKRLCPPKDKARLKSSPPATSSDRPPCPTRGVITNLSFPRTDPTVIMAVVSADGRKILLGRQKRWPPYWYSTLAGFIEPAESIEEAVRREVYEEAGVTVGRVVIHSSQPWPFRIPDASCEWTMFQVTNVTAAANLMIGAVAQVTPSGETIDLGNDPELDDAKWFDFEEVREALRVGTSGLGEPAGPEYKEGGLRLPPPTAIANQLISSIVGGFLGGEHKI